MGRKNKFIADEKIEAINNYINGKRSALQIANDMGIHVCTLRTWAMKYNQFGATIFSDKPKNKSYSKELKITIAKEYLAGIGSMNDLALKYAILSRSTILKWISLYNCHEELKDYNPKGEIYMAKSRKTTLQERIDIVNYCLANDKQYKLTAEKFQVSYTQAYQWVNKFIEQGEEGLLDQRGKRKQENQLSDLEKLQRENKQLKHKLAMKEKENILLKKVKEFERRLYSQEANKNRNI